MMYIIEDINQTFVELLESLVKQMEEQGIDKIMLDVNGREVTIDIEELSVPEDEWEDAEIIH